METLQKSHTTTTHKPHTTINHRATSHHKTTGTHHKTTGTKKTHIGRVATSLLHHGKKVANDLYDEGMTKVGNAEDTVKEYSDELILQIQRKPFVSLLIAGGIGFLLSTLFRR